MSNSSINDAQSETICQAPQQATERLDRTIFHLSPLIRLTLFSLYLALTLPLPLLAQVKEAAIAPIWLWIGIAAGAIVLHVALSEQVAIDAQGICVTYPTWVPRYFRKGWSLPWTDITALQPRSTGQGGIVYYFLSRSGEAYLLPMRVAGFAHLVRQVEAKTGIDTTDVRPLAQPWMYLILLVFTVLLFLVDGWIFWTMLAQPQ